MKGYLEIIVKFMKMFLSNVYIEQTGSLIINLDFVQVLSQEKKTKFAKKLAQVIK
jgi:hypothetical protein